MQCQVIAYAVLLKRILIKIIKRKYEIAVKRVFDPKNVIFHSVIPINVSYLSIFSLNHGHRIFNNYVEITINNNIESD